VQLSRRSTTLLKGLLSALHYSGADRLLALTRGDRSGRQPVPADPGSERRWRTTNVAEKDAAFYVIYWWLRSIRKNFALAKLTLLEARDEIAQSLERIERELGVPCRHLSYPYGDECSAGEREFQLASELGMKTGVTTRKGLIQRRHASALTALRRVSLSGEDQHSRYVKALFLNGALFAFANRRQRPQTAPFH